MALKYPPRPVTPLAFVPAGHGTDAGCARAALTLAATGRDREVSTK
jgi:hypothetical protein